MAFKNKLIKKYRILSQVRNLFAWFVLVFLRFFAKLTLLSFSGTIIGIAGAVGKSTARDALKAICSPYKPTYIVSGNSETGIPLGILGLDIGSYRPWDFLRVMILAPFQIFHLKKFEFLVVEMGIDGPKAPKNMGYLLSIIRPHIGIVLNESPAHVANYESLMGSGTVTERLDKVVKFMTEDDGQLLKNSSIKTVIVNTDDVYISQFAQSLPKSMVRTVGTSTSCDISLYHHEVSEEGTTFEFAVHSFQEKDDLILTFQGVVMPLETGFAIGSAILTALALNIPLEAIKNNLLTQFHLPPGRGTIFKGIQNSTIFDSSYNASSASVLSFLKLMKSFTEKTRRPTFYVFGDMKELGTFSEYEHTQVAKELPASINHLVLVGPLTKELVLPMVSKYDKKFQTLVHFATSREAGEYLQKNLPEKSLVLFKGSQLLEEAIKYILINKNDEKKLCRQDIFWEQAKKRNGTWV